jgi:hypothetical protein
MYNVTEPQATNGRLPDSSRHTTTEGILYSNLHNYKKDDGTKHPDYSVLKFYNRLTGF